MSTEQELIQKKDKVILISDQAMPCIFDIIKYRKSTTYLAPLSL